VTFGHIPNFGILRCDRCPALSGSRSQTSGNASQGPTTVHTAIAMHALSSTFSTKKFRSSHCWGLWEINSGKYHSTEARQSLFTNHKRLSGYKWKWGALRIYKLMLEPRSYDLHGVLDVGPGNLLRLHDGPLRHELKGDLGLPALETCQHMLRHCLRQGMTLCLQLQHLGPSRVKQREHNTDLFQWIPGAEGTEAKGAPA
jgi:hypothetical protein